MVCNSKPGIRHNMKKAKTLKVWSLARVWADRLWLQMYLKSLQQKLEPTQKMWREKFMTLYFQAENVKYILTVSSFKAC